jgi:ribosome recycling factor
MSDGIDFKDLQRRMDGALAAFRQDLASLRTGRASSNLLDAINVNAYGSSMPLNQVATVTVPEARMVMVQVWDRGLATAVDRAIRESGLGLNPITEGATLRIPLPELNEERRKSLVKMAHQYAESARVAARHVRRDANEALKKAEKDGKINEDDSRKNTERVQKITDTIIADIDKQLHEKEAEIMQV